MSENDSIIVNQETFLKELGRSGYPMDSNNKNFIDNVSIWDSKKNIIFDGINCPKLHIHFSFKDKVRNVKFKNCVFANLKLKADDDSLIFNPNEALNITYEGGVCAFFLDSKQCLLTILNSYNIGDISVNKVGYLRLENVRFKLRGSIRLSDGFENQKLGGVCLQDVDFRKSQLGPKVVPLFSMAFLIGNNKFPLDDPLKSESPIILQGLRKFYSELKAALVEKNDHINALDFHRYEMIVQKKLLEKTGKNWFNDPDAFVFWANETFSGHGMSWLRPLIIYIFSGIFFYFLYLLTPSQNPFKNAWIDKSKTQDLSNFLNFTFTPDWKEFWLFLLPVNFINFDLASIDSWGIVVKSAWWVFSLYLIYNMLLGFRKYSRKL